MESNTDISVDYSPPPTNPALTAAELSGGGDRRTSFVQEQPPGLEHLTANLRGIKWTDEKHSLYLESMEASFVNQLHDSINILGFSSPQHVINHNSSGQFKVFREGWRGKINFGRDVDELNKGDETEVVQITSNPWIRRYKSECRHHIRVPASFEKDLHTKGEFRASSFYVRHRVSDRGSFDQSLEVSDQNFIDEDNGQKECKLQNSKKVKTEAYSNNDKIRDSR